MTAPININDDFDDELLSAYVDDELTAAERALVEERLRVDPQARQMVEELRLLSSAIRSLPRETLGRDLRANIEAAAMQAKADAKADDDRNILPMSGRDRWANYRRGLVWSAITIAAALMLMMVQPKDVEQDAGDLAKAERNEELEESRKNRRGRGAEGELPRKGEMRALGAPQEAAKPMLAESDAATDANAPLAPAPLAPATTSAAPADVLAEAPQREESRASLQLDELEAMSKLESAAEPSAPPSSDAASLGTLADEGGVQGYAFKSMPLGGVAGAGQSTPSGDLAMDKAKDRPASAAPAIPPATIELAMTAPDGVARFEKLLKQHAIQIGPKPAAVENGEVKAKQLNEEVADQAGAKTFSRTLDAEPSEADRVAKADVDARIDVAGRVDVLVEASPEQIDALLAACEADKELFADVSVPESLVRNDAGKLSLDRIGGRAQRFAANEPLAKEAATAGEKKLAEDASSQFVGGPEQGAAGSGGGGARQRRIADARAWLLLPPQPRDGAMYWEEKSPAAAAPPAGYVRVLFRLRPLPLPAAPPAAEPADAKP